MFKDVTAEATGRLVVDAVHALGLKLTPQIAIAGVRRPGHRYRLVSVCFDLGQYLSLCGRAGRCRRQSRGDLQVALRA